MKPKPQDKVCAAPMCLRWAVEGFDLCDPHLEAQEEGGVVPRLSHKDQHRAQRSPDSKMHRDLAREVRIAPAQKPTQASARAISNLPIDQRRAAIKAILRNESTNKKENS